MLSDVLRRLVCFCLIFILGTLTLRQLLLKRRRLENLFWPKLDASPPFPSDPAKQFVYLTQLDGLNGIPDLGPSFDMICISWKIPVKGCSHVPNTTWTQGRNVLWKKAITNKKKYLYYIFMDDDIKVDNVSKFEQLLLKYRPAIGVPGGIGRCPSLAPNPDPNAKELEAWASMNYDAAFNAFHHDVVHHSFLFPYFDEFDHISWWLSQLWTIYLTQIIFPDDLIYFPHVNALNHQHRPYPRALPIAEGDRFFKEQVWPNEDDRPTWLGYHYPMCKMVHPKPEGVRYILPEGGVAKFADSSLIYWKRIMQIRNSKDGHPPMSDPPLKLPEVVPP